MKYNSTSKLLCYILSSFFVENLHFRHIYQLFNMVVSHLN